MEVDSERIDVWYTAISGFLELHAGHEDVIAPWSLVTALCRVLADAAEQVNAPDRKKLEAVMRLTAHSMGFEDVLVLLGKDAEPNGIS